MFNTIYLAIQRLHHTYRYKPEVIQKVEYMRWSPLCMSVYYLQSMFGGPQAYIHTKNKSVHTGVLRHTSNQKVQNFQNVLPTIPSDPKSKLIL